MAIIVGPAGFGGAIDEGLAKCKELGLKAAEVEFTYGVRMGNEAAKKVGELAKKLGISLSIHAPYYINLANTDKKRLALAYKNILESVERAHHLGAKWVCFHPAAYGKLSKEACYVKVKREMEFLLKLLKQKGFDDVTFCPETTGKHGQFGDLDELLRLSKETGCGICVDFGHLLARAQGELDYDIVLEKIKAVPKAKIYCHYAGVEWTGKGEKKHLPVDISNWKMLCEKIKKHKLDLRIINESPETYDDAVKMMKVIEKIF